LYAAAIIADRAIGDRAIEEHRFTEYRYRRIGYRRTSTSLYRARRVAMADNLDTLR